MAVEFLDVREALDRRLSENTADGLVSQRGQGNVDYLPGRVEVAPSFAFFGSTWLYSALSVTLREIQSSANKCCDPAW